MLSIFAPAFVSLFVIADPFGTAAVFSVLSQPLERAAQRRAAIKAALIAACLLVIASLVGSWLLTQMQISLAAFRIAGGILLFVTAFRMIMGFHDPDQLESGRGAYRDRADISVFPIAIPLLSGPGCITATLMFSTSAETIVDRAQVWLAIVLVEGIAGGLLLAAPRISRLLGPTGNGILSRIMGILLAAMAIQFIADGLSQLWAPQDHVNFGFG